MGYTWRGDGLSWTQNSFPFSLVFFFSGVQNSKLHLEKECLPKGCFHLRCFTRTVNNPLSYWGIFTGTKMSLLKYWLPIKWSFIMTFQEWKLWYHYHIEHIKDHNSKTHNSLVASNRPNTVSSKIKNLSEGYGFAHNPKEKLNTRFQKTCESRSLREQELIDRRLRSTWPDESTSFICNLCFTCLKI